MANGIGAAGDYYRVRLTRMQEADAPEFEWREDILWRSQPTDVVLDEKDFCRVEAVSLDDDDKVVVIGVFDCDDDAHEALSTAQDDLVQLTRSEFEERYFPADV